MVKSFFVFLRNDFFILQFRFLLRDYVIVLIDLASGRSRQTDAFLRHEGSTRPRRRVRQTKLETRLRSTPPFRVLKRLETLLRSMAGPCGSRALNMRAKSDLSEWLCATKSVRKPIKNDYEYSCINGILCTHRRRRLWFSNASRVISLEVDR